MQKFALSTFAVASMTAISALSMSAPADARFFVAPSDAHGFAASGAAPSDADTASAQATGAGLLTLTAGNTLKRNANGGTRPRGPGKLAGRQRVLKDTCPASDKGCIKDLTASCDKAGGGLSTQPDGAVDCYVVGIHDQP